MTADTASADSVGAADSIAADSIAGESIITGGDSCCDWEEAGESYDACSVDLPGATRPVASHNDH